MCVCFGRACVKDSRVDCTGACCWDSKNLAPPLKLDPGGPGRVFLFSCFYFNLIFSLLCKCFGYRETKQISSFSYVILLRAIRACCMYQLYCPKFCATSFVFLFCCFFMFFFLVPEGHIECGLPSNSNWNWFKERKLSLKPMLHFYSFVIFYIRLLTIYELL